MNNSTYIINIQIVSTGMTVPKVTEGREPTQALKVHPIYKLWNDLDKTSIATTSTEICI